MDKLAPEQFVQYPEDSLVYLVQKINSNHLFLVCNGQIIYAVSDNPDCDDNPTAMQTDYLELCIGVELEPVTDTGEKQPSKRYDFVRITQNASVREKQAFIDLCAAHATNIASQPIGEFFDTLYLLFSSSGERSKKDAIGLFGELTVIRKGFESNFDLSEFWQVDGVRTKYDFTCGDFNIEVKTTVSSEQIIQIRHRQLFNGDNNYLGFVRIEHNPAGESVAELADALRSEEGLFAGMHEKMMLEKELLSIREDDLNKKFSLVDIELYKAIDLNPFEEEIPERVTKLEYVLNVAGVPSETPRYFFSNQDACLDSSI